MLTWKWLLIGVPLLVWGCAPSRYQSASLDQGISVPPMSTSTDPAMAAIRSAKPQMRFPCRVAVYLKPPASSDWRWTPEDKGVLDQCVMALKREGVVAEAFPLPEILVGKGELKELRLAAARCGADALFLVHGRAQTDSYSDVASVFNLTLVGGYVVPSSHRDSLFAMEGVLLDVDNGYVYAAVQAEGGGKTVRPTFVNDERDSITMAKGRAVGAFGDELVRRMRSLAIVMSRTPANTAVAGQLVKQPVPAGGHVLAEVLRKPAQVSQKPVTPITSLPIPNVPTVRSPAIVIPATGSTAPTLLNMGAVPVMARSSGITSGLVPVALSTPTPEVPPMMPPVPVPTLRAAPASGGITSGLSSSTGESK